jgi:hypothetical protein
MSDSSANYDFRGSTVATAMNPGERSTERSSPSTAGRIAFGGMILFALLAILVAVYIGSYVYLAKTVATTQGRYISEDQMRIEPILRRQYPYRWQVSLFAPLGLVESWLRGLEVDVAPEPPLLHLR